MKRITSLLLLFTLLTVLAACGGVDPDNLPWDRYLADYGRIREVPDGIDASEADKPIHYFYLRLGPMDGSEKAISAADLTDGTCKVYVNGSERREGLYTDAVLDAVARVLAGFDLAPLDADVSSEDRSAAGCLSIVFTDGNRVSANFETIPDEAVTLYDALAPMFAKLAEDLPLYRRTPTVSEAVDPAILREARYLLYLLDPDCERTLHITRHFYPNDAGLSPDTEGVAATATCSVSDENPVFCSFARAEDPARLPAVCEDYKNHIAWDFSDKGTATDAVIATKGDLVICVVSKGEIFTAFRDILKEAGWREAEVIKNDSAG